MTVRLHARLEDEQLIEDFKQFVEDKYRKKRSFYSYEIELALISHLVRNNYKDYPERYKDLIDDGDTSPNGSAHTHKISSHDKILINEIYNQVQPGEEVPFNVLCKWMMRECGLKDTRTHKTHINNLLALGILQDTGDEKFSFYEVLQPPEVE